MVSLIIFTIGALNYAVPEIAKKEKSPLEILNEKLATGELSDIEYQNKIRLLKLAQEHLKN